MPITPNEGQNCTQNKNRRKKIVVDIQEMRRRRSEEQVQLRKEKREYEWLKRRDLQLYDDYDDDDDDDDDYDDDGFDEFAQCDNPAVVMLSQLSNHNSFDYQLKVAQRLRKMLTKGNKKLFSYSIDVIEHLYFRKTT